MMQTSMQQQTHYQKITKQQDESATVTEQPERSTDDDISSSVLNSLVAKSAALCTGCKIKRQDKMDFKLHRKHFNYDV